jgi:AbrB family looped-hinge helix DNA binding protein
MSNVAKISPSGQVRIPKAIMKILNVSVGDYLDFSVKDETIIISAKKLIDADQMWFWEKHWQDNEKKAEIDIKEGNLSPIFSAAEEGIQYLRKKLKRKKIRPRGINNSSYR